MDAVETFSILAREHEQMLHAYLLGLVGDPVLAQDIAQETFVKAFRNLHNLKASEAFPTWIRKIARNAAYDHHAERAREIPTDPATIEGMEEVFSAFDDPQLGDLWSERVKRVEACYQDLPDQLREVSRLHYFEERKAADIADSLAINVATVWKRLERARDELRECMEKTLALERL